MTLLREVLETSRETLKLKLDIDADWNPGGPYPYTWRPETGNFMYCMPQVGTRVSLYCPTFDEKTAIAVNCVRTNGSDCDRMSDPTKRSFVTEHGKEMNLYPNEMSLLSGDRAAFQLVDQECMAISLENPVVILAKHKVKFQSKQLYARTNIGEVAFVNSPTKRAYRTSSYMQSGRYDTKALSWTKLTGQKLKSYPDCNDELQEDSFAIPWNVVGAVLGAVALVAVATTVAAASMLVPVLACAAIGAISAGAVNAALQLKGGKDISELDVGELIIAMSAGAVSGAFAATPIGKWGQALINAGIGGVQSFLSGGDIFDVMESAIWAGTFGFIGGDGPTTTFHCYQWLNQRELLKSGILGSALGATATIGDDKVDFVKPVYEFIAGLFQQEAN